MCRRAALLGIAFFLTLITGSCSAYRPEGITLASTNPDKLGDLVQHYGDGNKPSASPNDLAGIATEPPEKLDDNQKVYENQIVADLIEKNYAALDTTANEARARKTRFVGGAWKLFCFYEALAKPVTDDATDADWTYHINSLKAWAAASPQSAAPLIALSEAYQGFAFKARGTSVASGVSSNGWKLFEERNDLAAQSLTAAAKLKQKCPYWYESMQHLSVVQGWTQPEARALLDAAVAYQPDYYHFYREYAFDMLPKWNGQRGDVEKFADETYKKVGGQYGAYLYFEIATLLTCQCDSEDSDMENLSWPKIKEGYAALGQLYGYSTLKNNRYAHMAYEAQDRDAARASFAKIGDDWDHHVWRTEARFEQAKDWAQGSSGNSD